MLGRQLLDNDSDVTRGVLYNRVLRFYDRGGKITNNVCVVLDPVYDLLLKEQA
ncbi:hypothetical protein FRC0077_00044 [Corynebacterium diphtheriae]|uniref:Uncharacterized protein n=1 Tax=Corynebacterium diphtheriae TaxID=1717 RepID=A0A811G7Z0_CORDP|nr:hypothetical protein CIP107547_00189 [Corynebacterium diphtheriae]CAB0672042.1 hypothetical protein FRC0076_00029 [Corynebacterium diphtheriae]CAB0672877.1 hypothetical protein FRC0077_00044 [Corynebacterium diphtheriae]